MKKYQNILDKLNQFTKKFYTKMLVKGALLFLAFGLLFFLVIMGVEYFLWLGSTGRLALLLLFVAIEIFLLFKYILTPLIYLFRLKRGISNKEASVLIGIHFPEVGDRLYNLLDLAEDENQSELLLASIEQRSENLDPIPFAKAIDYRESFKYAKYLVIPALIIGSIWISGNLQTFFGSYKRVVNYDLAYEPPAPFSFRLLSNELNVLESEPYMAQVTTEGDIRPENVFIVIEGEVFLLHEENGVYQHLFSPPLKDTRFYFIANGIKSMEYRLNALKTPSIQNFGIVLDFPTYTGKATEILKSTGNAVIPEGTKISWQIEGYNTERINLLTKDTVLKFARNNGTFNLSKRIYSDFPYQISTSNGNVSDYERLDYEFKVIKDAHPKLRVKQVLDSLQPNISYYVGEATDDYRLSSIRLVYYQDTDGNKEKQFLELSRPNSSFNQFYYTFPSGLVLEEGQQYRYYFEAIDNDAIHGGKSTKSQVFTTAILDNDQLRSKELDAQQSIIHSLDTSLERFIQQKEALKKINAEQREKSQLNFGDRKQIQNFLHRQEEQEALMQKFSRQLKENLEKGEKDNKLGELLRERLERQELEAQKNERLLKELQQIADRIDKEDLAKRLEELGKKQNNGQRNLEQLLELTKRYYITEMAAQLAKELEESAERQRVLSESEIGDKFSKKEQETLNTAFDKIAEELDELREDNQDLNKPLDLNINEEKKQGVKQDQKEALEELNKHQSDEESSEAMRRLQNSDKVKQKQKSAADKMKQMSEDLRRSASAPGGGSSITEDAEMLRQILDNLVIFSFKQEKLFEQLDVSKSRPVQFSNTVRKQQELRSLFEHVDDSLFALSLRRAELSESVNKQITEVYYNMEKSLENMAENRSYQAISHQKYVMNASNSLAAFLARILDNMQASMNPGKGSGQGEEFQLPDIIKGQGELEEKMKGMGKKGKGQPNKGDSNGQKGQGSKEGNGQPKPGAKSAQNNGANGEMKNQDDGQGEQTNGYKEGQSGVDGNGGLSEEELKEIYEIYKEQQLLRQKLQQQLQDMINDDDRKLGEKLVRQMEDFENDLIENGVTQRSMNKVSAIQYELLKLENAALEQGKKKERESNTNERQFQNPILTKPSVLDNYRNENEILNRQALPLRQNFQNRVKNYFRSND